MRTDFASNCPIPLNDYPKVLLAHGGGGRLMAQLIESFFFVGVRQSASRSAARRRAH